MNVNGWVQVPELVHNHNESFFHKILYACTLPIPQGGPCPIFSLPTSDGSGSKFFDPGWVGSAIYGLGLENFP